MEGRPLVDTFAEEEDSGPPPPPHEDLFVVLDQVDTRHEDLVEAHAQAAMSLHSGL